MARAARVMLVPLLQRDLGPWSPQARFERSAPRSTALLYAEIARRRRRAPAATTSSRCCSPQAAAS